MPTAQFRNLREEEIGNLIGELYDVLSVVKSRDDVQIVMRDLLTQHEKAILARRIQIAILLQKGYTHHEVAAVLKVGVAKVTAVNKSIDRNGEGYDLMIRHAKELVNKRRPGRRKASSLPFLHPSLGIWKSIFDAYSVPSKKN